MRVIVAGSRGVTKELAVFRILDNHHPDITEVVSGGARGADSLGEQWAVSEHIPIKQFIPDWEKRGIRAGFERNVEMAKYADALIAFWDGESKGTAHMIKTMEALGKPVFVYKTSQQ